MPLASHCDVHTRRILDTGNNIPDLGPISFVQGGEGHGLLCAGFSGDGGIAREGSR